MTDDTTAYINETFQKIRQLRASSKGEVWLAADVSGKLVVIKSVAITGLPYKMLKEHPQAVAPRVIYCTEHEGVTLVVEEYIQGTSLLERLEQRQYLTEAEAEQILLGLYEGLAPLHELGIIHRDIKPSNLILQNGGIIRLIDWLPVTTGADKVNPFQQIRVKGFYPQSLCIVTHLVLVHDGFPRAQQIRFPSGPSFRLFPDGSDVEALSEIQRTKGMPHIRARHKAGGTVIDNHTMTPLFSRYSRMSSTTVSVPCVWRTS